MCHQKECVRSSSLVEKQNPFYADVSIREDNLEWMQGENKVSIALNADKFKTKNSKQFQIITSETEYVSAAQVTNLDNQAQDSLIVPILTLQQCMQINLIPSQEETMQT
jgi:hypothetical protein